MYQMKQKKCGYIKSNRNLSSDNPFYIKQKFPFPKFQPNNFFDYGTFDLNQLKHNKNMQNPSSINKYNFKIQQTKRSNLKQSNNEFFQNLKPLSDQQDEFSQYNFEQQQQQNEKNNQVDKIAQSSYLNKQDNKQQSQNLTWCKQKSQQKEEQSQASNFWNSKICQIRNRKMHNDYLIRKSIQQQMEYLKNLEEKKRSIYKEFGLDQISNFTNHRDSEIIEHKYRHRLMANQKYQKLNYPQKEQTYMRMNSIGSSQFSSFNVNQQKQQINNQLIDRQQQDGSQQVQISYEKQGKYDEDIKSEEFSPLPKNLKFSLQNKEFTNNLRQEIKNFDNCSIKISEILSKKNKNNIQQKITAHQQKQKQNNKILINENLNKITIQNDQEQLIEQLIVQYDTKQFNNSKSKLHKKQQLNFPSFSKKYSQHNTNSLQNKIDDSKYLVDIEKQLRSGDHIRFSNEEESAEFQLSLEEEPIKRSQYFEIPLNNHNKQQPLTLAQAFSQRCSKLMKKLEKQSYEYSSNFRSKYKLISKENNAKQNNVEQLQTNFEMTKIKSFNHRNERNYSFHNKRNQNSKQSRKNIINNPFQRNAHIPVQIRMNKQKPPIYYQDKKQNQNQQLMERLVQGVKVDVNKKQMKQLSSKNYQKLPEVKKRKQQAKKKLDMINRLAKQKQFDRQNRNRMKYKVRYG